MLLELSGQALIKLVWLISCLVSRCFKPSQPQKDYIRAEGDFRKEMCSWKDQ